MPSKENLISFNFAFREKAKKQRRHKILSAFLIVALTFALIGQTFSTVAAMPNLLPNSKTLVAGRAIATWQSGIPAGEKRPVVVFLPGWGGAGNVNASVSAQNTNLVNAGYVTLAIGFDDLGGWTSNINVKTAQGLNLLCADATIPANCNAIVLDGESYGGAQNYWVIEYLRANAYNGGGGSTGKMLGFLSEDAGYGAPGNLTDPNTNTGAFTRTGLADTASYGVAMIQNLGDTTFPVDSCDWGNCGARTLSDAHLTSGDNNVFSICPSGGEHGTRGFVEWNDWVVSAIKTMIHVAYGVPPFTGYVNPTLTVSNTCVHAAALPDLSVSGINIVANGQPIRLRGINMGDPFWARNPSWYPMYSTADYTSVAQVWHANVVRISVFPTQWKNMNHAALLAGLAQEVNAALNNGMYVIISYHVIGWPNGWHATAYPGNPADTYDSNMTIATSFWTQMAQTYGTDKRIIFDLWNEPVHDSQDWNNVSYWTDLKPFYESLITTARNNGAQNIVLATGASWASWLVGIKDSPLADANVVYAYHKYSVNGSNTAAAWDQDMGGLIGVKPVIVSEWGFEDGDVANPTWPGSQASYGDPFTQWMDSHNLSNLAWMYHHDWTPALLKADGSLTTYGTFIKGYLASKTCPTVISIDRVTSNPTNFASVDFTVTFSQPVTGVDVTDFTVAASGGIALESIASVTPVSESIYTVNVNTGTGDGTIRLDVSDDNTIMNKDAPPKALGGALIGDGNFTTGQTYIIDKTQPTVLSITRANTNPTAGANVNFNVKFDEPVTGVDVGDFTLNTVGVTGTSISGVYGNGATRVVRVNTGTGNNGTVRLDMILPAFFDLAGNPQSPANLPLTGATYTVNKTIAFTSTAANDGWALESSEFSNQGNMMNATSVLRVGDDSTNKQYRSLLYFDTSRLPDNAIITKATVKIKKVGVTGTDPFTTHGALIADMAKGFFGLSSLETTDFQAPGALIQNAGSFVATALSTYQLTLNPVNFKYVNPFGVTQFRLRFTLDDNNNKVMDFVSFYGGDALTATDRPQLTIEYYTP